LRRWHPTLSFTDATNAVPADTFSKDALMKTIPTRHVMAAVLMGAGSMASAAQWTGYVFNGQTRAPMAGVSVRSNTNFQATTDAKGAYLLQDLSTAMERRQSVSWDPARQTLLVQLDQREALGLEVLDLSGRLLSRPFSGEVGPGVWRWSASSLGRSLNPVILRLVRGGQATTWTVLPGFGGTPRNTDREWSARSAATTTTDTFLISKAGFDSARVVAQTGSFTLDTAWLAPRLALGEIPWNEPITYGTLKDARDNKTYRTVRIGSQNWMAQNLNYKPAGADSGECYENKPDSCAKYGRHYDWRTAMAGQLASRYLVRPATGICPTGWHLPSQEEWKVLTTTVGTDIKEVARNLMSVSGWPRFGNGADAYGFRALPAGLTLMGSGGQGGYLSFWWTSSAGLQDSQAIEMFMDPGNYSLSTSGQLYLGHTLRCLEGALTKPMDTILTSLVIGGGRGRTLAPAFRPDTLVYRDTVPWTVESVGVSATALDTTSTSIWIQGILTNNVRIPLWGNGTTTIIKVVVRSEDGDSLSYQVSVYRPVAPPTFGIPWKTGITFGTLVDSRDGHVYRTVEVDGKYWMAQNLDYRLAGADSGSCVGNSIDSCAKYGRLYTWPTAMGSSKSSNAVPSGVKGICPTGWHLPSQGEWNELVENSGTPRSALQLKSAAGWPAPYTTNGTDDLGFRALPALGTHSHPGFMAMEEAGWWSTSSKNLVNGGSGSWPDGSYPVLLSIDHGFDYPNSGAHPETTAFPLRCVKN
jgi:uncharacterized protein (TIGR02145 family)